MPLLIKYDRAAIRGSASKLRSAYASLKGDALPGISNCGDHVVAETLASFTKALTDALKSDKAYAESTADTMDDVADDFDATETRTVEDIQQYHRFNIWAAT